MRPVNRPTATSSPPGSWRTRVLSDPMALATVAPRPTRATATTASAAKWLGAQPAWCVGRGGAGAWAEGWIVAGQRGTYGGLLRRRHARQRGDEEIHAGVLRFVPIQRTWQPDGRPPRSVVCSRCSPGRLALASVQPRWRPATGMNCWSVPFGFVPPSAPRHRAPRVTFRCRSPGRSATPRQSLCCGQSRRTERPRASRTGRRHPPPHRPQLHRQRPLARTSGPAQASAPTLPAPAQASAPALQAPSQAPARATPAPVSVVSGGS